MQRRKTIENAVLGSIGSLLLVSGILSILLRPEAFVAFFASDIILLGLGLLWIALFRDATFLPFDEERKKRFAYLWGGFLLALGFLGFLFLERYANASMGELVPPGESSLETNSLSARSAPPPTSSSACLRTTGSSRKARLTAGASSVTVPSFCYSSSGSSPFCSPKTLSPCSMSASPTSGSPSPSCSFLALPAFFFTAPSPSV